MPTEFVSLATELLTAPRLTTLLQNRSHVISHESLFDRCLEISLCIVRETQGPTKASLHAVTMRALQRRSMESSTTHPFTCYNMAVSETEPVLIGSALVLSQDALASEVQESLLETLAKVGLSASVHHNKTANELRDVVRRSGRSVNSQSFDLFLCIVVGGEDGRFIARDGADVDVRDDVVGIVSGATESASVAPQLCSCAKVFISSSVIRPQSSSSNSSSNSSDPFSVVVCPSSDSALTVGGSQLVTALVAVLEEHLSQLPSPTALNLQKIVDAVGAQCGHAFQTQSDRLSASKIVMQPNINTTVYQWLVDGALHAASIA
eukprot:gene30983-38287_t